jgi:hypothetical protein
MTSEQLQELMSKLKAMSKEPKPDRRFSTYSIVVDLCSDARSIVYGVDPELAQMVGDEFAIKEFIRFVKDRPISNDIYKIRLVRYLETPEEECIAKAERSKGFAVVVNPQDE